MIPRRRRFLRAAVALLAVATVTVSAASMSVWWRSLPPPDQCSTRDLVRWLATRDLTQESTPTRRALVKRMELELRQGIDTASLENHLNEDQNRLFMSNVRLLLRDWFEQAAADYAGLDAERQARFIDEKIAGVAEWDLASLTAMLWSDSGTVSGGSSPDLFTSLSALNSELGRWVDDAEGGHRDKLRAFASALRMRLLAKAFQRPTSSS